MVDGRVLVPCPGKSFQPGTQPGDHIGKDAGWCWSPGANGAQPGCSASYRAKDWAVQFGALGYTYAILSAGDISSSERLASRIRDIARKSRAGQIQWNRYAEVLGARDRWAADAPP
jgi:hypothetical protein